ncbi:multiple monosaccharide ABC transporter substrate-binding protein [Streptomyces fructofermentans]|uniref:multiple monosaccharide ABC transporter substrate-binding protein n=1 Tax=Streptomyces fructofermentans TaxID=152141 RepID=UPI0033D59018
MRARTTAAAAITTALSLSLSACAATDAGSRGTASIGITMPTKVSPRWIADGENMVDELKGFGYSTTLRYADNDPETQVTQVEAMIADGVDALVIASVDGRAFKDVLSKAKSANIPVISYDRLILGSDAVDYYATFDNVKVGQQQADFLVEQLGLVNGSRKGPFTVEVFAGSADDNNTRFFYEAAMRVLQPYVRNGDLIIRSGEQELEKITTLRWDGVVAEKRMNSLLDSHYTNHNLDAVLSPYDGMSLGIIKALKKHGYGVPGKPLPIVTGQDAEIPSIKSIMDGEQSQTVYKDTRQLALVTSYMVNSVVHGNKPAINDTRTYNNGTKVIPTYLIDPVSVDKGNYKEILLDSGYFKKSDLE